MPVRTLLLAALLALVAPVLVVVPAQARGADEAAARRIPRTTLVLRLPGPCPDCEFFVQTGKAGRVVASGRRTTAGDLRLRVPTRATRRMSIFFTNAQTGGDVPGASVVTFRFRGLPAGSVPGEEEVLPDEASACWTGTKKRRLVLDLVLTDNGEGMGAWVLRQRRVHPIWLDSVAGVTQAQETAGLCDPAYGNP